MRTVLGNEKGWVGIIFIFMFIVFSIPTSLLMLELGKTFIAREAFFASSDAASLAGNQEIEKIETEWGPDGQASNFFYQIRQDDALLMAQQTFDKNVQQLKLSNLNSSLLNVSFFFPDSTSMRTNVIFQNNYELFNQAKTEFFPTVSPTPNVTIGVSATSKNNQP